MAASGRIGRLRAAVAKAGRCQLFLLPGKGLTVELWPWQGRNRLNFVKKQGLSPARLCVLIRLVVTLVQALMPRNRGCFLRVAGNIKGLVFGDRRFAGHLRSQPG